MLEITTPKARLQINIIDFVSVDDIQVEVSIHYNIFSSKGNHEIRSLWFFCSGIRQFYDSLSRIRNGESISASLQDMSDEFELTISRDELEALVKINHVLRPSTMVFSLELKTEFDLINTICRQIADCLRNISASS